MRKSNNGSGNKLGSCVLWTGLYVLSLTLSLSYVPAVAGLSPVIFNFGDSNSDTGGYTAGLGNSIGLPYGRTFFHHPTGRFCDGRLIVDFLCESLNISYLSPYLEALGSNFENGANFAVAGCTALPGGVVPFSLDVQMQQFLHFRSRSLDLIRRGYKGMNSEEGFREALYMIDIGQNDITLSYTQNLTYDQIVVKSHQAAAAIRNAIQVLYDNGARNFWVHNTGPFGCLPETLVFQKKDGSELDEHGCLQTLNDVAKEFNFELSKLCDELSAHLQHATVVYTDMYAIKYDLITNYTKYGFEHPLMACCGNGGPPYNFNPDILCSMPGSQVCDEHSKFINWDSVHYTEAANAIVASKILSAQYSKPKLKFDFFIEDDAHVESEYLFSV